MAEEMITVKVTAYQKVEYIQHRRIPKSRFDKYESMRDNGSEDHEFCREFEDLIDTSDVCDADEIKDLTIDIIPVSVSSPPVPSDQRG